MKIYFLVAPVSDHPLQSLPTLLTVVSSYVYASLLKPAMRSQLQSLLTLFLLFLLFIANSFYIVLMFVVASGDKYEDKAIVKSGLSHQKFYVDRSNTVFC